MKKILMIIICCTLLSVKATAQTNKIYAQDIASLSVIAGDEWMDLPVTTLGGKAIHINFDELSHEYHRYTYKIVHCEADWTETEGLFESDYLSGFYDENTIDDCAESVGTYQDYTHYELTIPNKHCQITMSGNYEVTIMDDNNDNEPILKACFMVCEQTATIGMSVRTNTDIDVNTSHQQVDMQVNYGRLNVTDPDSQIKVIVLQNQCWNEAVNNPHTNMKASDILYYDHCRDLIFPGGNEYHKFETLDPTHTTMGLAHVGWDKERSEWHAYVEPDYPRPHYIYDVDADGSFLIRNSDNIDNDTQSDYIQTHFELHAPRQYGRVFLNGAWTYDNFDEQYEMQWNEESQLYETVLPLKQGYYSYRYILLHNDGTIGNISTEGDFFETENTYQALVYFHGNGERTDRLVGFASVKANEKN